MTRTTSESTYEQSDLRRRPRVFMFAMVLALLVAVGYVVYAVGVARSATNGASASLTASSSGSALVGRTVPGFSLPVLANDSSASKLGPGSFRGRPLVINFFASWCGPCNAETPMLAKAAAASAGSVAFLGVDENDQRSAALAFLARTGVSYPVVRDAGSLQSSYLLVGIPDTFFVAPDGRVIGAVQGQISSSTLENWLRKLDALAHHG
ncbi:Redoxin domain protein [Acidimicrobium ferrooxidans DSM 10331]|uniref:Redoxin domain protein n=1 Tax=Acidimicrobium ferrooxidans (strain DSM 10331 / JCM 15462 / NBRC 103882 / ICP) TaxID=525909 RepID=C7M0W8_ACIFD|nr:TlpA disulfide reductase family protein [Acidimicrobium ferrooxidans]ACU54626.1 Redoxin domain protein [Acidimicrobium ferrooxidans DSM 10331]